MELVLLAIAGMLIVSAVRDTQGDFFGMLKEDVPAFGTWAAAIFAIGVLGFIPGFKPISRGLLTLVIVVLVINNYPTIVSGFQNSWSKPPAKGTT